MKKQLATMLICLIMLTTILPAWAQESTDSPSFDLEQVIVTAAKRAQLLKDTPANVAVITGEDLQKIGAKTFDDALSLVAGVKVGRPYGMALVTPQSINIRGIQGPDRTLLLVDGVPINNGNNDFINLNIIPVDSIERIEVVKGGYSALYGSNALGGVINIITKTGKGLKKGEVKSNARAEFGNYGTQNYKFSLQGAGEKTNYSIGFEKNHTDNYFYNDRMYDSLSAMDSGTNINKVVIGSVGSGSSKVDFVERDAYNLDYDGTKLNGKINYQINAKSSLALSAGYSKNESGSKDARLIWKVPFDSFKTVQRDSENITSESYLGLNYENQISDKLKSTVKFSQTKHDSKYSDEACIGMITVPIPFPPFSTTLPNYVPSTRKSDSTLNKVELQLENKVNEKNYLTMGIEKNWKEGHWYYTNDNTSTPIFPSALNSAKDDNWAVYLQDEIKVNEKTDLVLGARYDKHSKFGSAFSPKAGLIHRVDKDTRLRVNAGHSFKAPGLYQLYEPDWFFAPFNVFRSNPDLKAEKVDSYDIGVEKDFNEKTTGSLTFFLNKQKDLITARYIGDEMINGVSVGVRQYQNLDSATAKGIEASLNTKLNDHWNTKFAYTYLDARDKNTDKRLDGSSLHNLSAGIYYNENLPKGKLNAGLTVRAVSSNTQQNYTLRQEEKIAGYALLDLNLGWQFNDKGDIFLNIYNLGDKRYQNDANNIAPGRSIIAGANFKF